MNDLTCFFFKKNEMNGVVECKGIWCCLTNKAIKSTQFHIALDHLEQSRKIASYICVITLRELVNLKFF
jgi:hypothetical protein